MSIEETVAARTVAMMNTPMSDQRHRRHGWTHAGDMVLLTDDLLDEHGDRIAVAGEPAFVLSVDGILRRGITAAR